MDWQSAKQTINNDFPMMDDQQALNPAHIVNGKATAVVHQAPSKWSYDQQQLDATNCFVLIPGSHSNIPPHQEQLSVSLTHNN
jgi:hypothetical protein